MTTEVHVLQALVDDASREIFGITAADTAFQYPDWYDYRLYDEMSASQSEELSRLYDEHWDAYAPVLSAGISDWADLGFDVLDSEGHVLESARYFARQMLCASKQLQKCKTLNEIAADLWASNLEPKTPVQGSNRAQSLKFLELGAKRRRHR